MTRLELAVIMVTDLVGSTRLASRLGSAKFDELRLEHDSILRDAAEDVGGRVVKNTGDGFLIVFPSAAGALDGAVHMQQRLERRNRTANVGLAVRIGISMGDVSVSDDDYFGIPPIEATRLCGAAAGGEILVSDPLRAVQRATHPLAAVGALTLKGLPEPLAAWRVGWAPLPQSSGPPLPARLRGVTESAYVGRAAELGVLHGCWERAVAGARQLVVIGGEPGIGKTRLVAQAAKTALPDHAVVLFGRCDDDQGIPYLPWREILRDYVQLAPRRLLRPHQRELARLVPGLSEKLGSVPAPTPADPDTERYLLLGAIQSLLVAASELAPLLVIIDDLQLADRSTLLLLKHLVTASTEGRLMLLATFRDLDVGREDQLASVLADLHREPGVTRLGLSGLGEGEIVALIEEQAGHPIDATGRALAGEIHAETAGNPFFVGELLRHLGETGLIGREADGRWSFARSLAGHGLPQGVREVIEQRVGRLGEEAVGVLRVAAVVGGEFDLGLLARAADLPAPRVLDRLDEAQAAALLTKTEISRGSLVWPELTEVYAFSHGLVRATLYDGLPAGRRAALHLAVGEAIELSCGEDVGASLAELALHFLAAGPAGDPARAVDYARRAGEQAVDEHAYDQAAALFGRALAIADGDERIGLLQAVGDAQMRAGDSAAARVALLEAADAARRADEPEALGRATRACAIWGLSLGVDDVLVGLAEEAIALLEDRGGAPSLVAELKSVLAVALYYSPATETDRRERLAAEALATARAEHARAGSEESRATLAFVLGRYLLARTGPDSVTRDFPLADEWLALGRELGDVEVELRAHHWRTTMLLEQGDLPALHAELERVEHLATELRQPRAMVFVPLHRGMLAMMTGRFAEAERLNAQAAELARRLPGSISLLAAETQLILMRLQQGRLPELEPQLRAMVAAFPALVTPRAGVVVMLLQAGREDEARTEFERLIAPGLEGIRRDNAHILTLALLGEAAVGLDDVERAGSLYEWLSPYAGRWVVAASSTALWPVDRSLGRLACATGDLGQAAAHMAAARRTAEQADALPSLALLARDEAQLRRQQPAPAGPAALPPAG